MKKVSVFISLTVLCIVLVFTGCGQSENTTADCHNGNFTGVVEDNGVMSFKGIPYAKAPVGDLRWKAPEPAEDSDEDFTADKFGKSSIQYEWHSEGGSYNETGEDCLTLNVWTKDLETKNKPVMFYIHGGGFAWGGTADNLYDGKYIVEENEDVVVVTTNYRVGMMGLIDFSDVEGGEDFPDSGYLSVLDLIQSLKWVQQNIEAFGGDPDNVTIFGESAGGAFVSILCAVDEADGLFAKAIAQSGSLNLTYTKEDFDDWGLTQALLDKTGAKNMDDLMAIPEDELIEIYTSFDEEGNSLNDLYNMPLRGSGSIIPEDPYQALKDGAAKDVIMMIGTNSDEWRYWVNEMGDVEMSEMDENGVAENMAMYEEYVAQEKYDSAMAAATSGEKSKLKKFLDIVDADETVWKYTEIGNETGFRMPSIAVAEAQNEGGGTAYMYYFCKKSDNFDFIGACHASELAYVFHNTDETIFSGTVDKKLADDMCTSWTNFARTGDPGNDNAVWGKYTLPDRATMVIGDDCSMKMVNDPKGEQRELMEWSVKYYLK